MTVSKDGVDRAICKCRQLRIKYAVAAINKYPIAKKYWITIPANTRLLGPTNSNAKSLNAIVNIVS